MKKILLTGGAGFIGSHTCLNLIECGYEIISLDSYANSSEDVFRRIYEICKLNGLNSKLIKNIKGDIRDLNLLRSIFENASNSESKIEAVVHFAGLKAVKESENNPLEYWDVNFGGTLNLINIMNSFNCRKLVFSSSATIYGEPKNLPISEESEIKPINPYGNTKATIEKFLLDIYKSAPNDWNIINLRYFNPVGAHNSGLIGENPKGIPNNLFPYICKVASGEIKNLKIFGNDWPTKDGTGVRDYIHIEDLAEGHKKALNLLLKKDVNFLSINLGNGLGVSVLEMIEKFEKVNNCKIKKVFESRREGDVASTYADIKLAEKVMGWKPKKTLSDICRDGWNWQKKE